MNELMKPIILICLPILMSCGISDQSDLKPNKSSGSSDYLFVWAGAENTDESDFLAVIDVNPDSPDFGDIVSSVQVGVNGAAHHSEHVMPKGDSLFVGKFRTAAAGSRQRHASCRNESAK